MIKKNILKYAFILISINIISPQNSMSMLTSLHRGLMLTHYVYYSMQCYNFFSRNKKIPKRFRLKKSKEVEQAKKEYAEANTNFNYNMMFLFSNTQRKLFLEELALCKQRLGLASAKRAEKNFFTLALIPLLAPNQKDILVYY